LSTLTERGWGNFKQTWLSQRNSRTSLFLDPVFALPVLALVTGSLEELRGALSRFGSSSRPRKRYSWKLVHVSLRNFETTRMSWRKGWQTCKDRDYYQQFRQPKLICMGRRNWMSCKFQGFRGQTYRRRLWSTFVSLWHHTCLPTKQQTKCGSKGRQPPLGLLQKNTTKERKRNSGQTKLEGKKNGRCGQSNPEGEEKERSGQSNPFEPIKRNQSWTNKTLQNWPKSTKN